MWTQSPSSFLAQYAAFAAPARSDCPNPKVYIDGIEVANPLLITQISPEAVERIEAIRAPGRRHSTARRDQRSHQHHPAAGRL